MHMCTEKGILLGNFGLALGFGIGILWECPSVSGFYFWFVVLSIGQVKTLHIVGKATRGGFTWRYQFNRRFKDLEAWLGE
ncbi:hypothetical protein BD289DRAFT_15937 [Coniella lustricola]|uniref:Uncharacterized protein n=1 Tax=Coniella lustricola TaxID=2025994 RepID=A0A2T3A3V9_9PEZI|nr:hypothetical protein BD289DRAFT_15937 [Coniella lustricola]